MNSSFKKYIQAISFHESHFIFLESNDIDAALHYQQYQWMSAFGAFNIYEGKSLQMLDQPKGKWLFGYLTYDLKNSIEDLSSNNADGLGLDGLCFFEPKHLIYSKSDLLYYNDQQISEQDLYNLLIRLYADEIRRETVYKPLEVKCRMDQQAYLKNFEAIKKHILDGDIYELNLCIEFYAESASISPLAVWQQLNALSPTPYAAFLRSNDSYLMCASPERYLCKRASKLIAQPIKGTAPRSMHEDEDLKLKDALYHNQKERSENVMIVDLMRNDLAKSAQIGSVQVEELYGIYSFKTVHQMISTISAEVDPSISVGEIIANSFPMGSMTGCPKVSAMKLIEQFECSKRGLFSGSVGYIAPNGDFDFNVVIRSILYDASKQYLSFQAGSAITYLSNGLDEWNECLLKAATMRSCIQAVVEKGPSS